jgi:basic membrane protein A
MRAPALLALVFAAAGCGSSGEAPKKPVEVGLVFDIGGRGDRSFNDAAYRGLERAQKELGVTTEYVEPTESGDHETALRRLSEKGVPLVFGIGFAFTDPMNGIAKDFPGQKYACVDYTVNPGKSIPPNVSAIRFREEEGCFLVGAIAALTSKTKKVGFVGGMDIPLIQKFRAGYEAGVKAAVPDCEVLVAFAGLTPQAFKDPVKGKELARSQFGAGADVIFHASGSTGIGVFDAAKEHNRSAGKVERFVIGVDSDQWEEGGHVLTSMVKAVDLTVFESIRAWKSGSFAAGERVFGLRENGVGYVRDDRNRALIPDDVHARVEAWRREIVEGKRTVPAK